MTFKKIKNTWDKYNKYIKIIGTIILLSTLFLKINLIESIKLFREINLLILIPLLLYPIGIWLSSIKWKIALENKNYSLIKLSKIYWVSNFFSNFLPSTIGGDSYKVMKLKKEFGYKKTIYSILLDRGTGLFTILLVLFFSSIWIYNKTENIYFSIIPIFSILTIIIGYFFLSFFKIEFLQKLITSINQKKKTFIKLILTSIPFVFLGAFSLWVYYFMYGYNLSFFSVLVFYCLIQFIGMIPISINGFGLREGALVYLFLLLGVPAEVSLSIGILSRLVMILQTSIGGLIYLGK